MFRVRAEYQQNMERNFIEGENPASAVDTGSDGLLEQPGHGTATIALLAGQKVNLPQYSGFNDYIGAAPFAEIVPIRIATSVILFKSSSFVKALRYINSVSGDPDKRCDVVSMSMGGVASKAWAREVNQAYENGVFIVTAAGNNMGGKTPTRLVYPARFNRVVAACGVTYNYTPYYDPDNLFEMQGNFGPKKLMNTAIAAFTPNLPWARFGCGDQISLSGAGTSSATPQVAAAAAIYLRKHKSQMASFGDTPWKFVESVKHALFSSALDFNEDDFDSFKYFGNGILKACEALNIAPNASELEKLPEDTVRFPLMECPVQNESATKRPD